MIYLTHDQAYNMYGVVPGDPRTEWLQLMTDNHHDVLYFCGWGQKDNRFWAEQFDKYGSWQDFPREIKEQYFQSSAYVVRVERLDK